MLGAWCGATAMGRSFGEFVKYLRTPHLFGRVRIDLFADYGARIEVVSLEPPLPEILSRNARRTNPVPERVILRLADKLEPPTPAEAHGVVVTDEADTKDS